MNLRVAVVTTHPIQYQAPLFRAVAQVPGMDLTVVFGSDQGVNPQRVDPGFGRAFAWDLELLDGYPSVRLESGRNHQLHGWRFDAPNLDATLDRIAPQCLVVFGWNKRYYWRAFRWARRRQVPVLVRGESNLLGARPWHVAAIKRFLYPSFFRRVGGFLVIGKHNRAYYERYGVHPQRLFSAPYCVDNDYFRTQAEARTGGAQSLRADWGLHQAGMVFLFVGKLCDYKRPLDAIAALRTVDHRDCRLVVVGDGPLMSECRTLARGDPYGRVRLAGFKNQSELPTYYAAADVLVLPSSTSETWGLVANEAMACGLPCLLSEGCGCAPDLIIEGVTGFTFPVGDVSTLAERMRRLLGDPARRAVMGMQAKSHVQSYSVAAASHGLSAGVLAVADGTRRGASVNAPHQRGNA
jgi:glycosyltransferase involved in cell wall biosynthesis